MLVLTRKRGQSIMIGDDIEIIINDIGSVQVSVGVNAPRDMPVHRREVYEAVKRQESESEPGPA